MITRLKYFISDTLNPYKNLAIEKYLLDNTPDDCCTLYLWQNQNTVVIGRNQNPWAECNVSLVENEGGKLARRLSGGGAVFHDTGNLNFTFLCSNENFNLEKQFKVLQTACNIAGIKTEASGRNDILAEGKKFSGNAFYNSKGKSYHHGTILIRTDKEKLARYLTPNTAKLESKGVKSVKSRIVNLSELNPSLTCEVMKENMLVSFGTVYREKPELFKIPDTNTISELEEQYKSWDYLYGQTFPFTLSLEKHFEWGCIKILFRIENGIIKHSKTYTDCMDWTLSEKIDFSLSNCRFEQSHIRNALLNTLPEATAEQITKWIETALS